MAIIRGGGTTYDTPGSSIYFHQTAHSGHTAINLQRNPRVCFEVDKPGRVFPSGAQSACHTSIEYQSVVAFGECRRVDDAEMKKDILRELVARYADPAWKRPEDWVLLDTTAVYEIRVETLTGKRRSLGVAERWGDSLGLGAKEIQE